MLKRLLPLTLLAAFALPGHAGLFDDDEARKQIASIRDQHAAQLKDLSDKLDKLDARSSQKLVELVGQLDALNQQIATLRGQLEVATFTLQSLQKRQQDLYVDIDGRVRALEESKPAGQNPLAQAASAQQEAEAATAYEAAYNLYRDNKLKPAADAFAALAQKYPSSQAAPNALFWQGMAQAQGGDDKGSIAAWRRLVDSFPDHAKSPEALKAIASVQLDKGDRKGAVKTLKELVGAYPNSDAGKDAAKQLKKL
ncbi:YbgF trimerization domain-containing protein [Chitinimonas sp.]|uniref:YbgF trimerization domain-containing protein n=1 Tax=Chitinimonas sp. TaxID=1934313 RepID=UPI0035AEBD69